MSCGDVYTEIRRIIDATYGRYADIGAFSKADVAKQIGDILKLNIDRIMDICEKEER